MEENIALENKKTLISTRILKKKTKKNNCTELKVQFSINFFLYFLCSKTSNTVKLWLQVDNIVKKTCRTL